MDYLVRKRGVARKSLDPATPSRFLAEAAKAQESVHDTPGLGSDPNGDGVNLLMAYALNLDPKQNLQSSIPRPLIAGSQMGLTFYAGTAGVTYSVETSTDLQTWTSAGVTLSTPDANNLRTASAPTTGPNRFMRLVVIVIVQARPLNMKSTAKAEPAGAGQPATGPAQKAK